MYSQRAIILSAIVAGCGVSAAPAYGAVQSADRPESEGHRWSAEDSISVRYVTRDFDTPFNFWPSSQQFVWSPDRRHFVVLTHRGDLGDDSNIFELRIFSADAVRASTSGIPAPYRLITRRAYSSLRSPFTGLRWSDDGTSIYFLAPPEHPTPDERLQITSVYSVNLATGQTSRVTPEGMDVDEFYQAGNAIAFRRKLDDPDASIPSYPAEWMRRQPSGAMNRDRWPYPSPVVERYVQRVGGTPRRVEGRFVGSWQISRDGRYGISRLAIERRGHPRLVDMETGQLVPTFAPEATRDWNNNIVFAYWSGSGRHVIVGNIKNPVSGDAAGANVIASYDLANQHWQVIEDISTGPDRDPVIWSGWAEPDNFVILRQRGQNAPHGVRYRFRGDAWVGEAMRGAIDLDRFRNPAPAPLQLAIEEGPAQAPQIVATVEGRRIGLLPEDPVVLNNSLAPPRAFTFRDAVGATHTASVTLPAEYRQGRRVPVVVQASNYLADRFLPDGVMETAYATQGLAARGIGVIQMDTSGPAAASGGREGEVFRDMVEAAVNALVVQGIADPSRIGLTGFSRSCYHTRLALTHPGAVHFAAAVCADGYTGDYNSYLLDLAADIGSDTVDDNYGGAFWRNKSSWLERETTFNLDRITTPTLFSTNYFWRLGAPGYDEGSVRWIGGLRANRVPFDYLFFPSGSHNLQRPRERQFMLNAVVDWYAFWLKDEAPHDAALAERWRGLASPRQEASPHGGQPVARR